MSVIRSAVIASVLTLAAGTAHAQQAPCGNPVDIAERLAVEFGEAPAARGIDAGGDLVVIYANPETGTWTVLLALPNGPACIVSTGTSWEPIAHVPTGRPS
jgi:hypothetical protein